VKALAIVALIFSVLAVPSLLVLATTARGYLETTADIASLRIEIVELRPSNDPTRPLSGPEITLRVYGVSEVGLTFEEVNFDLLWQNQRIATVAAFPRLAIPRNSSLVVTVSSNLDADRADATRELIAGGERDFAIDGNARIGLPNSDGSVWLTLRGQVSASQSPAAVTIRGTQAHVLPTRRWPPFVSREVRDA
jgi:hypothetical protein